MNQSSGHRLPSFFITDPMPCPYIDGQMERKLFTYMTGSKANDINNNLTHAGFRRSQTIAYRPACDTCNACRSVRVDVKGFVTSKSFKRILRKNDDLSHQLLPTEATQEQYDLLRRYLDGRHRDGGMSDMTPTDYRAMVEETAVRTELCEYRDEKGRLIACLLLDNMQDGISLVYSFFDPDMAERSLGSFIVLDQITRARKCNHHYVYLGYLIENCSKMSYKKRFTPLQILGADGWESY